MNLQNTVRQRPHTTATIDITYKDGIHDPVQINWGRNDMIRRAYYSLGMVVNYSFGHILGTYAARISFP